MCFKKTHWDFINNKCLCWNYHKVNRLHWIWRLRAGFSLSFLSKQINKANKTKLNRLYTKQSTQNIIQNIKERKLFHCFLCVWGVCGDSRSGGEILLRDFKDVSLVFVTSRHWLRFFLVLWYSSNTPNYNIYDKIA